MQHQYFHPLNHSSSFHSCSCHAIKPCSSNRSIVMLGALETKHHKLSITLNFNQSQKQNYTYLYDKIYMTAGNKFNNLIFVFLNYSCTGYSIIWNQLNIKVFRPDVECTNGIIHVIDHPFLEESDVRVSGTTNLHSHNRCVEFILIVNVLMGILKIFV